jgi:hypothetical protein
MPNNNAFASSVNVLLGKLEDNPALDIAIDLSSEIVSLLGETRLQSSEDVFLNNTLDLPNAERYDSWFQPHPIFKSDRACFDLADAPLLQAKFYWLKKRSRQILAGGVHFTPNYEDEEFTHNERYKVGLDFFLSPNGKSLQVVLSNRGNLRIVELSGRLNNTQKEIFEKWIGAGSLKSQEALHTTLWESFKLKSVNQKFYDGVSNSFTELLQHLKSIDKDEEEAKLFASRLLGRLLFCWFLRKKGIIDESVGYFNAHGADATTYYKQSLERLFFLTLNTPIDERDELTKQHQKALSPDLLADDQPSLFKTDQKTPYLNGGLFEPHENDWYKDDSLTLPEGFFTNLYDHFEEFNFTTDESSPEYEQIAIDPEMLGRVFESLLATQLEESGEQARKAKGAFYTPREIVSFMCRESLRSFLYGGNQGDERYKKAIDDLLDTSDREWASAGTNSIRDSVPKEYRNQIIEALDRATILDPACGSGAFPMGMLQLCLRTYERLESRFDSYKTKLEIIQNNIFGVDIEPMAVEIARLRAWLSLIVDEEDGLDVEPLPNLDFKFVCANSLVPLENSKVDIFNDPDLHQKLAEIRTKYFNARKPHSKKDLQLKYYKLKNSKPNLFENTRTKQLKSFDPFKNNYPSAFFDAEQMFGLSGFDIIIGNPPYVSIWKIQSDAKKIYEQIYKTASGHYDLYVLFYEMGLSVLKRSGVLTYITSNKWMAQSYGSELRKLFLSKKIISLLDFSAHQVFDSATVDTQITVLENSESTEDYNILIYKHASVELPDLTKLQYKTINTSIFKLHDDLNFKINLTEESIRLIEDINATTIPLSEILYTSKGAELHSTKDKIKKEVYIKEEYEDGLKNYIEGKYFEKYKVKSIKYLDYQPKKHKAPVFPELFESKKIIVKNVVGRGGIQAVLDDNSLYNNDAIINAVPYTTLAGLQYRQVKNGLTAKLIDNSNKYSLEYILGILNAKVSTWYFIELFANGLHFYPRHLRSVRIPIITNDNESVVESIVTKVKYLSSNDISSKELEQITKEIDELCYQILRLNKEDISLIENSIK